MWPRGDATQGPGSDMTASRRTKNAGLSGFVSFMKRKDAEAALRELDGFDWGGSVLRVGWSKAVPIAARPLYGTYACCHSHAASYLCLDSIEEDGFAIQITIAFEVPVQEPFTRAGISTAFFLSLAVAVSFQGLRPRLPILKEIEKSFARQGILSFAPRLQSSFQ